MEAVILSNSDFRNLGGNNPEKYIGMINSISKGGISGTHFFVGSEDNLAGLIRSIKPDIVFSGAYFTEETEESRRKPVHSILESLSVPYIGSGTECLELVLSKAALKDRWQEKGILTPEYYVVRSDGNGKIFNTSALDSAVDFPYIVKPSKGGNSRGITERSIVHNQPELRSLVQELSLEYDELLVESYIGRYSDIREFTVSMIGNGENMVLAPAEIILKVSKPERVITTKDKDEHYTSAVKIEDEKLSNKIKAHAKEMFFSAGIRDYSRCDILLGENNFYSIEINGQPMIPDKWVERCMGYAGIDKDQYLNAIFLAGISRNISEGYNLRVPIEMEQILPSWLYASLA